MSLNEYRNLHDRLTTRFGSPSSHRCGINGTRCKVQGHDWAFFPPLRNGKVDWSRVKFAGENQTLPYILNQKQYVPACVTCHQELDELARRHRKLKTS